MDNDVINSYMEIDEEHRLQSTLSRRVEFISTVEALSPYLKKNSNALDVGCGVGIYSLYLAQKGIKVTSIDLVPAHIKKLKKIISEKKLSIKAYEGNAINLSAFNDNCFEVVLCMGPLYHLINEEEQKKCISECIRVVKPNGIVAFAYISPYSVYPCVLRGNLSRCSLDLIKKIVDDKKVSSDDSCCFWTDNYYYTPEDIKLRLMNYNLDIVDHLATDGQSIAFQSVINSMNNEQFNIWLEYHRKTCRISSLLGASNHGLIIARKKV